MNQASDLKKQLRQALAERDRLRNENARLKAILGIRDAEQDADNAPMPGAADPAVSNTSSSEAKIRLFRSLFKGREDVFAVRWEGRGGKSGYSPACRHEWKPGLCGKPKVKCAQCPNRELLPLTDQAVHDHLIGKRTVGVYPLLLDQRCHFLAADFDKQAWQLDVTEFLTTCEEMGVPAALERSRSGRGAHVWIFFNEAVSASLARRLGCALLTRTMERRHQLGLDSYDRFFPNQNTLPKGGFGNLIALPLQKQARAQGNSVFLNTRFEPYADQWAFLSEMPKTSLEDVQAIVDAAARDGQIIGVSISSTEEDDAEDPWTLPPSGRKPEAQIEGPFPERVRVVLDNLVYVEKQALPPAMQNRLVRLAAFQNPDFYKTQAMRLPTFGKPRVIGCADELPRHIGLPRGCLPVARGLLDDHGIEVVIDDKRFPGQPIDVSFVGELRPAQYEAAKEILSHDIGVLSATTAFGKTVVAAWLIAARKRNTLVLVHRRQLMDQWRERLVMFLGLSACEIGGFGGGRKKRTGIVDIATIQSLNRKGEVNDLVAEYGHVIVDECHHVSAFSFEQVLKQTKARYVLGLTATPIRKDGHHPIIMMQCGPIRFRVRAKAAADARPFEHTVIPRATCFRMQQGNDDIHIQTVYSALARDADRNELIAKDLIQAVREGRSPLLLTERTQHLDQLAERLKGDVAHVIVLRGGMGKKERQEITKLLESTLDGEDRALLSTGRYIGEGFDDPRLDTLLLAMPISWRGTLQQYAGRLHRLYDGKKEVRIYDYVDEHVPVLARMYERRLKGYRAMGYAIRSREGKSDSLQQELFPEPEE